MKISIYELKKIIKNVLKESLENKLHVVFLIGPPASGKSTFLINSKFKTYTVLSHDKHISKIAKKYSKLNNHIYSDHLFQPKYKHLQREATEDFLKERSDAIKRREHLVLDMVNGTKFVRDVQKKAITAIILDKKESEINQLDIKNNLYTTAIVFSDEYGSIKTKDSVRKIVGANQDRFNRLDSIRRKEEQDFISNEEIESREGDIKNVPSDFILRAINNLEFPINGEFDEVFYVGIHPSQEEIKQLGLN